MRDFSIFNELLLREHTKLRRELEELGHVHQDDAFDYDPSVDPITVEPDESDRASQIEDFAARAALEVELEKRYREVHTALDAILAGTYGVCVHCHKEISDERLRANPAARTCSAHTGLLTEETSSL